MSAVRTAVRSASVEHDPLFFTPFPGARLSCPWCSTLFVDDEPVCGCLYAEEGEEAHECPCCQDRADQRALDDEWDEFSRDYDYDYSRDYDAEQHAEDSFAWAYSEWCVPGWDWREDHDGERYEEWRRAFPELAWSTDHEEPCLVLLPSCPETWERWETAAEAIGFLP